MHTRSEQPLSVPRRGAVSREAVPVIFDDAVEAECGERDPDPPRGLVLVAALSIFVGFMAAYANVREFDGFFQLYAASTPRPAPLPPAEVPAGPNVVPHDGDLIGARGVKREMREAVVEAVAGKVKLSADRRKVLDDLLADAGADIFPEAARESAGGGMISAAVLQAWEAPAHASGTGMATTGNSGVVRHTWEDARVGRVTEPRPRGTVTWFRTKTGMVQVGDSVAVFAPHRSGRECRLDHRTFTGADGKSVWSSAAVNEALDEAKRSFAREGGNVLNGTQAAVLAEVVRGIPAPRYAKNWDTTVRPFRMGGHVGAGTVAFEFGDRALGERERAFWILSNGHLVELEDVRALDLDPRLGRKKVTRMASPPPHLKIPQAPVVIVTAMSVSCAGLGLLLMIAAGLSVAGVRIAGVLHRFYGVATLVAVALAAVALAWLYAEMDGRVAAGRAEAFLRVAVVGVGLHCLYPVVVLVYFNRREVCAYFEGGAAAFCPRATLSPVLRVCVAGVVVACTAAALGHAWIIANMRGAQPASVVLWHLGALVGSVTLLWFSPHEALRDDYGRGFTPATAGKPDRVTGGGRRSGVASW